MTGLIATRDHARAMAARRQAELDQITRAGLTCFGAGRLRLTIRQWARIADEIDGYLANDPEIVQQPTDADEPLEFA